MTQTKFSKEVDCGKRNETFCPEYYVFSMTPSRELLEQCEKEYRMLVVFVRGQDFVDGPEMMTRFGLYPSEYLYAYIIPDNETFEGAKARILIQLEKETKATPMWFAPAGTTRGKLTAEDVKEVLYVQSDEDVEYLCTRRDNGDCTPSCGDYTACFPQGEPS